ncbi:hypothetical protein LMG26689_02197 [Achromobacter animicus]|nr:hypothetical protein LMG26689_02197 [Achromobacter animicus]
MLSSTDGEGKKTAAKVSVDDSILNMKDSHLTAGMEAGTAHAADLRIDGGSTASIQGGSIDGTIDVWNGSTLTMRSTAVAATHDANYGLNVGVSGAWAKLEDVTIGGPANSVGYGIALHEGSSVTAKNVNIDVNSSAIFNRDGTVSIVGGTLRAGQVGLFAEAASHFAASIDAEGTQILVSGSNTAGVLSRRPGAHVSLTDVALDVTGTTAAGFDVSDGARIDAFSSLVQVKGAGATGVEMLGSSGYASTVASLNQTQMSVAGPGGDGVKSMRYASQDANTLLLSNGSSLQTHDGVGFLLMGGDHDISIENSQVIARTGGDETNGVLLKTVAAPYAGSGSGPSVQTDSVTLDAKDAFLTGDVLAHSGHIDIDLKNNSVLTGAVVSAEGSVDSLSIDESSAWNMRGNSILQTLTNAGVVSFAAPVAQTGFKTLTVTDYAGGGVLIMNTQLGDDASLTDKLVVDGGAASGLTGLRILNAAGTGALTTTGISLVQAVNGATIAADAFQLDAGSSGYRPTSGTLGLNGYEYFLVQGGTGGVASDWYLTSVYMPEEGGPIDPGGVEPTPPGSGVETPPGIGIETPPGNGGETPPGSGIETPPGTDGPDVPAPGSLQNISPETGVRIGNQVASTRMFVHRLADRTQAKTSPGQPDSTRVSRQAWARTEGTRHNGMQVQEGAVTIDTDAAILQMGVDLLSTRLGQHGVLTAGIMAGAGDARTRSTSTLMHPGTGLATSVDGRGKVAGYSVGIYGTAYADDASRLGAYADSWLQFGRYSNEINSELGSARYSSNTWTASVETGYAFKPFAAESELGAMVVVPQAQFAYTRYDAQDAVLPSMTLKNSPASSLSSRVGVRVYPLGYDAAASSARPYVEANWLHNSGRAKANVGASTFHAKPMRDAAELRIGVAGNIRESWQVSGELFGQAGNGGHRGYGGMLNVGYRW